MKVTAFENKNNVEHFPIDLKTGKDGKVKSIIGQKKGFKDFLDLSPEALEKRNNRDYPIIASSTYSIQRIDVDDLELFKQYFDLDLLYTTPHYLSRNKRLPHFYIKLVNCNLDKHNLQLTDENKTVVCDILKGHGHGTNGMRKSSTQTTR